LVNRRRRAWLKFPLRTRHARLAFKRVTKRRAAWRIDLPVVLQVLQDGLKEVVRGHAVLAWCATIHRDGEQIVAQ
jgi:hypothetical protein